MEYAQKALDQPDRPIGHSYYSHNSVHQLVLHHGHRVDVDAVTQYAVECCRVHVCRSSPKDYD